MRHNSSTYNGLSARLVYVVACVLVLCVHSFAQAEPADSVVFDSVTAVAGEQVVLTAQLNNTQSLIFSNNTACEPSTLAVIPAISYFVETLVFTVLSSLFFFIFEI